MRAEIVARGHSAFGPRANVRRSAGGNRALLRVRDPALVVELAQRLFQRTIFDDDYPPWLDVASGRRPRRRFEHAIEDIIGDRVGPQSPYSAQRAHRFVDS